MRELEKRLERLESAVGVKTLAARPGERLLLSGVRLVDATDAELEDYIRMGAGVPYSPAARPMTETELLELISGG